MHYWYTRSSPIIFFADKDLSISLPSLPRKDERRTTWAPVSLFYPGGDLRRPDTLYPQTSRGASGLSHLWPLCICLFLLWVTPSKPSPVWILKRKWQALLEIQKLCIPRTVTIPRTSIQWILNACRKGECLVSFYWKTIFQKLYFLNNVCRSITSQTPEGFLKMQIPDTCWMKTYWSEGWEFVF